MSSNINTRLELYNIPLEERDRLIEFIKNIILAIAITMSIKSIVKRWKSTSDVSESSSLHVLIMHNPYSPKSDIVLSKYPQHYTYEVQQ